VTLPKAAISIFWGQLHLKVVRPIYKTKGCNQLLFGLIKDPDVKSLTYTKTLYELKAT